jgi:hypothetical protein
MTSESTKKENWERILKEIVMAQLGYDPGNCWENLKKKIKPLSQDSWYPAQEDDNFSLTT